MKQNSDIRFSQIFLKHYNQDVEWFERKHDATSCSATAARSHDWLVSSPASWLYRMSSRHCVIVVDDTVLSTHVLLAWQLLGKKEWAKIIVSVFMSVITRVLLQRSHDMIILRLCACVCVWVARVSSVAVRSSAQPSHSRSQEWDGSCGSRRDVISACFRIYHLFSHCPLVSRNPRYNPAVNHVSPHSACLCRLRTWRHQCWVVRCLWPFNFALAGGHLFGSFLHLFSE